MVILKVDMIGQLAVIGLVTCVVSYAYAALKPPVPKKHHVIKSPRVKLSDGRNLVYKERGVSKDKAVHKIILSHAFGDSKELYLPISQDIMEELQIYILSFDRAGYGESDPNPKRSVKSEAFDIQELADKLQIGPKFYVIGISLGAYSIYSCLKYIPHRLSGAALVVPLTNYWWNCFPTKISRKAFHGLPTQHRWALRVAHHAPWLLHWWMTQKWFPSMSFYQGMIDVFSQSDHKILEHLPNNIDFHGEKSDDQHNIHESLFRDLMVGYGKWEFDPTNISNPFPSKEGCVHIWQGCEDKIYPVELNKLISDQLPWINYHEVAEAGHLLIYDTIYCEDIFRSLVST